MDDAIVGISEIEFMLVAAPRNIEILKVLEIR